jgi:hypothetical protein
VEAVRGCRVSTPPTLGNPPLTSGPNHQSPGGGVALVAPRQGDTTRTFDILCQTDRFRRCSTARNVRIQTLKRKPMSPLVGRDGDVVHHYHMENMQELPLHSHS